MSLEDKWEMRDDGICGKRYEKKINKKIGGHLTSGSGNGAQKGDVRLSSVVIEVKTTTKNSFSLQKSYLNKIKKAALEQGRDPALLFSFVTMDGSAIDTQWICVELNYFLEKLKD